MLVVTEFAYDWRVGLIGHRPENIAVPVFRNPSLRLVCKSLILRCSAGWYLPFRNQMFVGQGTGIVRKSLRFRARFAIVALLKQMVSDAVPYLL